MQPDKDRPEKKLPDRREYLTDLSYHTDKELERRGMSPPSKRKLRRYMLWLGLSLIVSVGLYWLVNRR